MTMIRFGNMRWIAQGQGSVSVDKTGVATGRMVWHCLASSNPGAPITIGSGMPGSIGTGYKLTCDGIVTSHDGERWVCEASFAGTQTSSDSTQTTTTTYELDFSATDQPIETHPKFTTFAGTPDSPINGATFDANGNFLGFSITGDNPTWAGVRTFLGVGAVYRIVTVSGTVYNDLSGVGQVASPSGAPSVSGSRTWLYTGASTETRGSVVTVRQEWRLSGPGGWNPVIYSS